MTMSDNCQKKLSCSQRHISWLLPICLILLIIGPVAAAPLALLTAAEQGDPDAQFDLAISLLQEDNQPQNYAEAVKWFRLAAEKGHAQAQYSLALRYLFGQGVKKNHQTAAHWLQQAADQGLSDGQFSLGLRYYWGQGREKNLAQAGYWFDKAAQQGHPKAIQFLAKLQARHPLSSQQRPVRDITEQLIADYAKAVLANAKEDPKAGLTKQELEKKMTAREILLAIQLSAKQQSTNQAEINDPELPQRLAELSRKLVSAEDYFLAGNTFIHAGQLQMAIAVYEKSLEIAPNNAGSRRNLASAYAHSGENRKAIENLQRSINLSPGQAEKHATLGLIYHADQKISAALVEYRTAARINPGVGWIYPDMADILIQQKDYSVAWKAVRQAELLGHAKERISIRLAMLAPDAESSLQDAPHTDLHLRQLVLPSRQVAENALKELQGGRDFNQLAKNLSVKQFRRNGGYSGLYQPRLLTHQFKAALKDLPPLAFSPIVETAAGFHILQKFPFFDELLVEH